MTNEEKAAKYDAFIAQQKTHYDIEAENGRLYRELRQAKALVAALQKSLREADDMYVASDTDRRRAEDKLAQIERLADEWDSIAGTRYRNAILDIIRK